MRIELAPGLSNVIRFPLEQRAKPSIDLLRDIAPDAREVGMVLEAFFFDDDIHSARETADREIADYIANNIYPEPGAPRSMACCRRKWRSRRRRAVKRMTQRSPGSRRGNL